MSIKFHQNGKHLISLLMLFSLILSLSAAAPSAYAKETSQSITGRCYEFDTKRNYTFSDPDSASSSEGTEFGALTVSGNCSYAENIITVKDGVLTFAYSFDESKLTAGPSEWHVIEDSGKRIDSIELHERIKKGALILETSLDGEKWVNDVILTNVFTENSALSDPFYTTVDVQQQNGCYYRVVVAYEAERITGTHPVAYGEVEDKEIKRVAEIYEFFVIDRDVGKVDSAMDTPRKELGAKVKTDKDKGFSGTVTIDRDDPHYGWDLGVFTVNGYTRETKDDKGTPVFLKNVDDRVVLWFTLKQDIDCLNGSSALTISDDTGAYDQHFEIDRTNFGRGTLIIRHTDFQGVKHEPVIYTNYLAANTRTGADTKVHLFEEGDYEVSLDYEIRNNPRQVGPVSVIPTYTDYKITFSFSIRNGNCMVFPFDVKTNAELADRSITANGFRLDMAKSRYLTIDVERQTLKVNADGTVSTDTRFNRPAKDNETYSDEGIYIFTVKNLYTDGQPTKKTVYVGTDRYLDALSKNGLTIEGLNAKILDGYAVEENGSLSEPADPETEHLSETGAEPSGQGGGEPEKSGTAVTPTAKPTEIPTREVEAPENLNEGKKSGSVAGTVALIAVAVAAVGFYLYKMNPGKAASSNKEDDAE